MDNKTLHSNENDRRKIGLVDVKGKGVEKLNYNSFFLNNLTLEHLKSDIHVVSSGVHI